MRHPKISLCLVHTNRTKSGLVTNLNVSDMPVTDSAINSTNVDITGRFLHHDGLPNQFSPLFSIQYLSAMLPL